MNWLKSLLSKFLSIFKSFVDEAVDAVGKAFIAEFKDFAVKAVADLSTSDLSSDEKRKAAFNKIKAEAIAKGKTVADSTVNLLIELAVSKIKQNT